VIRAERDPGSFRDPGGTVFHAGDHVLRALARDAAGVYRQAEAAGLIRDLVARGLLLPAEEMERADLASIGMDADLVLKHPRLPFVSYPYEWCFAAHRSAALLHIDLHLAALERGFTLSDATAYNVQFIGSRPVFIDHLSLRPYRDGEIWMGHRQFCMQFLNPLLLRVHCGVTPNAWFRGALEGIEPEDLSRLLPWRSKLSFTVLPHVVMQSAFQRRSSGFDENRTRKLREAKLPSGSYRAMLVSLRAAIARLRLRDRKTVWSAYAADNSYSGVDSEAKQKFVSAMIAATRPRQVWDMGCNTGDYAALALKSGAARVIGFDFDHGALDRAFARAESAGLDFLPLWLDAANPSPSQGWAQRERSGLAERAKPDALLALAFLHHLAIGRNVPLDQALAWLIGLAPVGVIEFPPRSDPMVQRLLALRADIFQDFTEANFLAVISASARVIRSETLPGGRLLAWYDRA
jgi:ribosomal protein L11 methylase PrmA